MRGHGRNAATEHDRRCAAPASPFREPLHVRGQPQVPRGDDGITISPEHVFGNVLDVAPTHLRKACGLDGGVEKSAEETSRVLPKCR
eukprot:6694761-Alexandrium_andersonii.AAC.1